ncbi:MULTISPECIES: ABC transporter permease [Shouchella]|uniref:ABC transporter permease n=1 Tax=Shouchella clausii TaxID=79880 RepID=A0A268S3W0_SHOCL|nr:MULTISPECIES: ABC transporter permease [Shouchella]PAD42780.1 ABC transporter permease [Bacillus sp. 7520-S]AST98331.1 multidrug ABC transporter permease [Shouchella clausii]MBU8597552.1 ABC transporter permease [Shouchella clausii]MDO7282673.1 ABC transporter permease [Shouchella clausii]MDO7302770.1 ABC transporter permease [Shouchella clausii]
MRSYIKKDLLTFWRDRKELITVLVLPILLVVVLNFAFSGLLGKDEDAIDLRLAIVNQDDETEASAQLKEKLLHDASFSEQEAQDLVHRTNEVRPVQILVDYFESDELKEWVTVYEIEESEAVKKVGEGEIDGFLLIPDGFTADSLYAAVTGESPTTKLTFKRDKETGDTSALYNIIHGFMDHLNYHFALETLSGATEVEVKLPEGGLEQEEAAENFSLTQYFTITMAILFALFTAMTVATKTGHEMRQQVFNRILIAHQNRLLFLVGKTVSTFCLAWLQIMLVFTLAHFILGVFPERTANFWLGLLGIVTSVSFAIAGLAAIFTTILLKMKKVEAANGLFMLVIILFGVVGGNFVPIYILPDWLQQIGEWTPNGLALVMFTEWIRFEQVSSLVGPSVLLIIFFVLCSIAGLAFYPKRGEA